MVRGVEHFHFILDIEWEIRLLLIEIEINFVFGEFDLGIRVYQRKVTHKHTNKHTSVFM